jgi:hypothetical protein
MYVVQLSETRRPLPIHYFYRFPMGHSPGVLVSLEPKMFVELGLFRDRVFVERAGARDRGESVESTREFHGSDVLLAFFFSGGLFVPYFKVSARSFGFSTPSISSIATKNTE